MSCRHCNAAQRQACTMHDCCTVLEEAPHRCAMPCRDPGLQHRAPSPLPAATPEPGSPLNLCTNRAGLLALRVLNCWLHTETWATHYTCLAMLHKRMLSNFYNLRLLFRCNSAADHVAIILSCHTARWAETHNLFNR
jgi:hypothetical protein